MSTPTPTTRQQVDQVFDSAMQAGVAAATRAQSFTDALRSSLFSAPTVSASWQTIAAPALPTLPVLPTLPSITFTVPGPEPTSLNISAPEIRVDDFDLPDLQLNVPSAPQLNYGTAPTVPGIRDISVPSAPELSFPPPPVPVTLTVVPFEGIDTHSDWLSRLTDIPVVDIVKPVAYSYARGESYASALLDELKATLLDRTRGGTGLAAAVERAIWGRARDRETQIALGNEADISRQAEALGYKLPPGVLTAQLRAAHQTYYDKLSGLSRDISVKQAELEQQNVRDAITAGMQMESTLIDYSYKLEQLSFETSRATADNAVQLFNTSVEHLRVLSQQYEVFAGVYKALIDSEMSKVEVYKAQLEAENTKAVINRSQVEAYTAQVEAGMAQVEIYRAQVGAAQTLVQLEEARMGAAGEQVRAYVAQVNAETAKVEAYKAQVSAEAIKAEMHQARAQVLVAKAGVQAEHSRAQISRFSALHQAKAAEWDGYRARVEAETQRIQALGAQSNAQLDGYRAAAASSIAQAEMQSKMWEAGIKQYEAGQTLAIQAATTNVNSIIAANSARLDAAKVGAQVHAQLAASAYGMVNANAAISSSHQGSNAVSFSYSGEVTSDVTPRTII